MEIVPGVHRVEGVSGSNCVLILDEQMAVVDTGLPGNGEKIVSYITSIGRSPSDLRWIVLSHFHFDHSGSAMELHQLTGAKIVAHAAEVDTAVTDRTILRKGTEAQRPSYIYRVIMTGRLRHRPMPNPQLDLGDIEVHETVSEGDVLPVHGGLRIIHTPGHTPGSISPVLLGPKVLFLGDSALNNIDRLSRPLTWDRRHRRQLDESLTRLRDLDADVAMFGHGPPVTESAMEKVRGLTDTPYDVPTWRIALKHRQTLKKFQHRLREKSGYLIDETPK